MPTPDYNQITDFILSAGKRLASKAGKIDDIGITKQYLTEEDLAIERGLGDIVASFGDDHVLFAEEENRVFQRSKNIWVADPISGTHTFLAGRPHYSIVISHLVDHKAVFAAVYDSAVDELFTAYKGKGAFLNGQPINVDQGPAKNEVILRASSEMWNKKKMLDKFSKILAAYQTKNNSYSMAVNYCEVACGRADGIIAFTRDDFPEFAGGFIIREAGGKFTNLQGDSEILPTDRIFIGGCPEVYEDLLVAVRQVDVEELKAE